jgi:hypothetical protein
MFVNINCDLSSSIRIIVEIFAQTVNHKFHRSVIIIDVNHLEQRWLLESEVGLDLAADFCV